MARLRRLPPDLREDTNIQGRERRRRSLPQALLCPKNSEAGQCTDVKAYRGVTLCLTAVFLGSAGIVLLATAGSVTDPTRGLVKGEALHSLLIGPEDLPRWEKVLDLQMLLHQGKTPDARESLRRAPDALLGSLLNHGLSP